MLTDSRVPPAQCLGVIVALSTLSWAIVFFIIIAIRSLI